MSNKAMLELKSLVDLLWFHATTSPDKIAYRQLNSQGEVADSVTYKEFQQRVIACAVLMGPLVPPSERVLIALKHGIDYIAAIFAVMMLGGCAIPFMPISARSRAKMHSILETARPKLILHDDLLRESEWRLAVGEAKAFFLSSEGADSTPDASFFAGTLPMPTDTAIIQFTSGSTSEPKAVCLTHRAILHNESMLAAASGTTRNSHILCWMPMHHDMGLMGNVFQSFYLGASHTILSPLHILQRPEKWLRAISEGGKDVRSGGPNFIYDICIEKIKIEEIAEIDLSDWSLAFNGAEMIQRRTMDSFSEKFASLGFRKEIFFPCYGMAESSVFVTGIKNGVAEDLRQPAENSSEIERVACGSASAWSTIKIVDSERAIEKANGENGEIWVSSASLAHGYLQSDGEINSAPFSCKLPGVSDLFYRTGDEGVIREGMLYVTGRRSDVIKVRGLSIFATDVETYVARHLAIHQTSVAAVQRDGNESCGVYVLIELEKEFSLQDEMIEQLKAGVLKTFNIVAENIIRLRRNTLPKTSSGKLDRKAIRAAYSNDAYSQNE